MRVEVETKDIVAAVTAAGAVIASRGSIPVMECALIKADDRLTVTGTNMDIEVTAEARASISAPGAVAVNAADLRRFLSAAQASIINLEVINRNLTIRAGRSKVTLTGFDAADFPQPTAAEAPYEVEGAASGLAFCAGCASTEVTRYYLCGVHVEPGVIVATDGHKLAMAPGGAEISAIIPGPAIPVIAPILKAGGRLFVGPTIWMAEREGARARGKLIEGTFPDWRRVVPSRTVPVAAVDADDLMSAIQQAAMGRARQVFLDGSDGEIRISGDGWDGVPAETSVSVASEVAEVFAGALSVANALAALKPLTGSTISISSDGSALRVEPVPGDGRVVVIMPWRHSRSAWPQPRIAA